MGINFTNGKFLILLLPAVAFTIWLYSRNYGVDSLRDRLILGVRCLLISIIILALSGLELVKFSKDISLVFVVDKSHSTGSRLESRDEFIRNALEYKTDKFNVGAVTFAKDAFVEYPLDRDMQFTGLGTTPQPDFTNIETGLKLGYTLMPQGSNKRMVLVSDGEENVGDALSYARTLSRHGVVIDVFHISTDDHEDMQITSVELPGILYEGEEYDIRVVVDSNISKSSLPLKLYGDRELIGEQTIDIKKGQNIFLFKHKTSNKGIIGYEARLDIDDANLDNNSMAGFTYVEGKPLMGIVEGEEGSSAEIVRALDAGGIDYRNIDVGAFPKTLDDLRKYSGIILSNVSLEDLREESQSLIENFVESLGRGLIVIGGDNSYALGDYKDSILEKVMPLSMDISSKAHIPSLGLILVIDRSGSMMDGSGGVTRLDLAKEAAIQSVETLRPVDTVGVVAFDTMPTWIVDPVVAEDKKKIADEIGTLSSGGGTDMYPGLVEAYNALEKIDAKLKHIIALSDGQSMPAPYDEILGKLESSGITLSTVALGEGADRAFLEDIAMGGRGRYYYADEFSNIPKIFTKETHMAAQSYVQNRTFSPAITSGSSLLANIDSLPNLDGYLTTTAKPRADVALISDEGDPILASWQYGLGKVVAWTSDFQGIWTEELLGSDPGGKLWLNSISFILPSAQSEAFSVETRRNGDRGEVVAKLESGKGTMDGRAIVISPDGSRQEIDMQALRPGEYRGIFDIGPQGVYSINVIDTGDGGATESVDTALAVSYSPEYDIRDRQGMLLLERIAKETGGRVIEDPKDIFRDEGNRVWKREELGAPMLPILLILFILDIGLRRINLGIKKKEKTSSAILFKRDRGKTEEAIEDQFTSDLLKAREDRRKF